MIISSSPSTSVRHSPAVAMAASSSSSSSSLPRVEVTVVAAQGLKRVRTLFGLRKMSPYAVAFLDPQMKRCTAALRRGGSNPIWDDTLRLDMTPEVLRNPSACLTLQIFNRNAPVASTWLPLRDLLRLQDNNSNGPFTLQLWRPSGRPHGRLQILFKLLHGNPNPTLPSSSFAARKSRIGTRSQFRANIGGAGLDRFPPVSDRAGPSSHLSADISGTELDYIPAGSAVAGPVSRLRDDIDGLGSSSAGPALQFRDDISSTGPDHFSTGSTWAGSASQFRDDIGGLGLGRFSTGSARVDPTSQFRNDFSGPGLDYISVAGPSSQFRAGISDGNLHSRTLSMPSPAINSNDDSIHIPSSFSTSSEPATGIPLYTHQFSSFSSGYTESQPPRRGNFLLGMLSGAVVATVLGTFCRG